MQECKVFPDANLKLLSLFLFLHRGRLWKDYSISQRFVKDILNIIQSSKRVFSRRNDISVDLLCGGTCWACPRDRKASWWSRSSWKPPPSRLWQDDRTSPCWRGEVWNSGWLGGPWHPPAGWGNMGKGEEVWVKENTFVAPRFRRSWC